MVRNLLRKSAYAAASIFAVHCLQGVGRSSTVLGDERNGKEEVYIFGRRKEGGAAFADYTGKL